MDHDYIPIDVDSMPYVEPIELGDNTYNFRFFYNEINDTFYVDVSDYDGNLILPSEPLMLNQPLWRNINNEDLPVETIIPMDESGVETEINADNLGDTVQLCIDNLGDDD